LAPPRDNPSGDPFWWNEAKLPEVAHAENENDWCFIGLASVATGFNCNGRFGHYMVGNRGKTKHRLGATSEYWDGVNHVMAMVRKVTEVLLDVVNGRIQFVDNHSPLPFA
jgi:hypothetical protein